MRVEEVMTKDVRSCLRSDTLDKATRVMWEHDCGFVPVIEDDGTGTLAGVLTDRDICMAAYKQGKRLSEIGIERVMSTNVRTCNPADSLAAVEGAMSASQVRRLPVVDEASHVVGVISLSDIAREAARVAGAKVTQEEVGGTLANISRPRQIEGPSCAKDRSLA